MKKYIVIALVTLIAGCSSISEDVISFALNYARHKGARVHIQQVSDSTSVVQIGTLHGAPIYTSLPLHDSAVKAFRGFFLDMGWDSTALSGATTH